VSGEIAFDPGAGPKSKARSSARRWSFSLMFAVVLLVGVALLVVVTPFMPGYDPYSQNLAAGTAEPARGTRPGARAGADADAGTAAAPETAQQAANAATRMQERPVNSTVTVPHRLEAVVWLALRGQPSAPGLTRKV